MAALINDIRSSFNRGNSMVRKLILINLAVFLAIILLQLSGFLVTGDSHVLAKSTYFWIYLPDDPAQLLYQPWSIFTYMFAHQGVFHILFNLLWLYYFGNLFQEYLGNKKFLKAYIYGGLLGGLFYLLGMNLIPVYQGTNAYLNGASAGVMAVITGIATLLPNYEIRVFVWDIKLKYIALFVFLTSVIALQGMNAGGNMAHLGGAVFGFFYVRSIQRHTFVDVIEEKLGAIFRWVFKPKKDEKKIYLQRKGEKIRRPDQAEVDAILDKISRSGYESLTKTERETLFKASKADDYR